MKRASIDIGSNSVLLLAALFDEKSSLISKEILNESFITSLGRDLDKNKEFHPDSLEATYDALKSYKKLLESVDFKVEETVVTATEASRVARNSREFFKKIKKELGFNVQIISSEGEAFYTALGVSSSILTAGRVVIMDMGGASTELILVEMNPFKIINSISLPVGSVRASDWKKSNEFDARMRSLLNSDLKLYYTKNLVCVAGSMTALATMYLGQKTYSGEKIEGMEIAFNSFKDFSKDLQNTTVDNLLLLFPFLGKRATVVGSGASVAELIGEALGVETIKISTRGLRYGTVISGGVDEQFISE